MKFVEKIKLKLRAKKYQTKNDKGGIAYILSSVKPGNTAIDIGAHKAGYLYFMLQQAGAGGKVYAFEPQTNLFQYLTKLKRILGWQNVVVEQLALSDKAETVTLYIPGNSVKEGSSPGATIVEEKGAADANRTETVSTKTLDAYCKEKNIKPDFIKIDVEGNELKVLHGGLDILKTHKPKILIEIEERHVGKAKVLEAFELLHSLGYKGSFIYDSERKPLSEFNFEVHQNLKTVGPYCNNFTFE